MQELYEMAGDNPQAQNEIDVALEFGPSLGSSRIAAWDYSRYVSLCSRGYYLGYLSEEEAWSKIMPAARARQGSFSSWSDLGENYLIGRRFWSVDETAANGEKFSAAYYYLLSDCSSPWVTIPWSTHLGGSAEE